MGCRFPVSFQGFERYGSGDSPSRQAAGIGGYRWSAIPYLSYVEVNLQLPGIRGYSGDVLLLARLTPICTKKVPVMEGSKVIDKAIKMIKKGEMDRAIVT